MQTVVARTLALVAVVGLVDRVAAGPADVKPDEAEARALLDKAIRAAGGAGPLAKVAGVSANVKGTLHVQGGRTVPFNFSVSAQGADRFRMETESVGGRAFAATLVVNGKKNWLKSDNNKRLAQVKDRFLFENGLAHDLYALQLAQLLTPLKDKAFRLSTTGEIQVGDRPALGFRVIRAGRPDVNLYFDKKSGLPVRCELRFRVDRLNQEYTHEILLHEPKDVGGIKAFTKLTVTRDDTKVFSATLEDLQFPEQLDEKTFAEP